MSIANVGVTVFIEVHVTFFLVKVSHVGAVFEKLIPTHDGCEINTSSVSAVQISTHEV